MSVGSWYATIRSKVAIGSEGVSGWYGKRQGTRGPTTNAEPNVKLEMASILTSCSKFIASEANGYDLFLSNLYMHILVFYNKNVL